MTSPAERHAPEGAIWVCGMCGKTHRDRYGEGSPSTPRGWDESCMLHAVLADQNTLIRDADGYVRQCDTWKPTS